MAQRRRSAKATCPCGSGKLYQDCCWDKGFAWVEEEPGELAREVPLTAEVAALIEEQQQKFRRHFGREPGPDDLLFFDAPPLEHIEHHLAQAMQAAGLDPALIHAFEKTGLLVTEENQHLIPENELQAWYAAIAEFRARQEPA